MTRRRLLLWSAPVVLLVVVVIVKATTMVLASRSATTAYATGDADTLRRDVTILRILDVHPSRTALAAGGLAVLDGRLDEAERQFDAAGDACPAVTNLVLVRETRGDDAVGASDGPLAIDRYRAAVSAAREAPGCFGGNDDPDAERRATLADTVPRLERKLAVLERPLPPQPPPPAPTAGGTPPPPPSAGPDRGAPENRLLNPEGGAPLDKLREILRDAAAARGGP